MNNNVSMKKYLKDANKKINELNVLKKVTKNKKELEKINNQIQELELYVESIEEHLKEQNF